MQTKLETITPQMAKEYLSFNKENRPVSEKHVNFLASEIENGNWQLNGASLVFINGLLADGQHRMLAVTKADKPIETMVTRLTVNEYDTVFATIDANRPRSVSDVLATTGEANARALMTTCKNIIFYRKGSIANQKRVSSIEIMNFIKENPGIKKSIERVGLTHQAGLISTPLLSFLHFIFSEKDQELADTFVDGIQSGFISDKSDPFFLLRERLIQNSLTSNKLNRYLVIYLCLRVWNAKRSGEVINKLQLPKSISSVNKIVAE